MNTMKTDIIGDKRAQILRSRTANKQLDISDIDKEEFDPNTEKYNFLENYPDPRVDKFYYKDKEHR